MGLATAKHPYGLQFELDCKLAGYTIYGYCTFTGKSTNQYINLLSHTVGPKPTTRGGWMGADQNFFEIRIVGRCPKVTANPQTEISENSYGLAISTPKTRIATWKQKRENQLKTKQLRHRPVWPVKQFKTGRPVWPVSPTGLTGGVQKTPKI